MFLEHPGLTGGNTWLPRGHPPQPLLMVLGLLSVHRVRAFALASRGPSEGRWTKNGVRRMGIGPQM